MAGPRVAQAADEINRIRSAFYPGAWTLQGSAATAQAVARVFERSRLAHVAAHGTFRADNPQFSALELADGPLTAYDLEGHEASTRVDGALGLRLGTRRGPSR